MDVCNDKVNADTSSIGPSIRTPLRPIQNKLSKSIELEQTVCRLTEDNDILRKKNIEYEDTISKLSEDVKRLRKTLMVGQMNCTQKFNLIIS